MIKFIKDNMFYLILLNTLITLTVLLYLIFPQNENVYYVDNVKLFNEFSMTKQMKVAGEREFNMKKKEVDSLQLLLQKQNVPNKSISELFIKKSQEFEKYNQEYAINEVEKIWTRVSTYSKEFSEEKGYTLVIGSDNQRNVLFASKKIDVTNELLSYINNKYDGK